MLENRPGPVGIAELAEAIKAAQVPDDEEYDTGRAILPAVETLLHPEQIYGRDVEAERLCSLLCQQACHCFDQIQLFVPGFAVQGLKRLTREDIGQSLEAARDYQAQFRVQDFPNASLLQVVGPGQAGGHTYVWKDALRAFDVHAEMTLNDTVGVFLGLISAVSPAERD